MGISLSQLTASLDAQLLPHQVTDYCPNGLQIEGKPNIQRIITGVTASQALIDQAVAVGADAILVHHGYFWKGESPCLVGMKARRIGTLLRNNISLLAYHLPLDIHPTLGNNVQLAHVLGFEQPRPLPSVTPTGIVYMSEVSHALSQTALATIIEKALHRTPLVVGDIRRAIKCVAWCTGGGQSFIEQAALAGADAFITGEASEQTVHIAREMGIHFFSAGHHATERYGIRALGQHIQQQHDVECLFLDIDNPV
jgi:dinuclear metal center YbgI/SA1388 family protein